MQHRDREIELRPELRPQLLAHELRVRLVERSLEVPVDVVAICNHDIRLETHTAREQAAPHFHVQEERLAIQRWPVVAACAAERENAQALGNCSRCGVRLQWPGIAERLAARIPEAQLVRCRRLKSRRIEYPEAPLRIGRNGNRRLAIDHEAWRGRERLLERCLDEQAIVAGRRNQMCHLARVPGDLRGRCCSPTDCTGSSQACADREKLPARRFPGLHVIPPGEEGRICESAGRLARGLWSRSEMTRSSTRSPFELVRRPARPAPGPGGTPSSRSASSGDEPWTETRLPGRSGRPPVANTVARSAFSSPTSIASAMSESMTHDTGHDLEPAQAARDHES